MGGYPGNCWPCVNLMVVVVVFNSCFSLIRIFAAVNEYVCIVILFQLLLVICVVSAYRINAESLSLMLISCVRLSHEPSV